MALRLFLLIPCAALGGGSAQTLDVGDIEHFHVCKAIPRRALSDYEECYAQKLAARCTPADDCLVTCLMSPDGHEVGGGCAHVCFETLHALESPPKDAEQCGRSP